MASTRDHGPVHTCSSAVATLVALITAAPAWARVPAPGDLPATQQSEIIVEIDPAPDLPDADQLVRWVEEDALEELGRLSPELPRRGVLHITLAGALYDYRVEMAVRRDGESIGAPEVWACECSYQELRESCRTKIPAVVAALEVKAEPAEPTVEEEFEPTPRLDPVEDAGVPRKARKRPITAVATASMTLGAVGVAIGIPLIALGDYPKPPGAFWVEYSTRPFRASGIVITAVGAAVLVTGVVLRTMRGRLSRRRARSMTLAPSFDVHGQPTLSASGSF